MKFETQEKEILPIEIDNKVVDLEIDMSTGMMTEIAKISEKKQELDIYDSVNISKILFGEQHDMLMKLKIEDFLSLIGYVLKDVLEVKINSIDITKFKQRKFEAE